jgi:hypothetical protein
VKALPRSPQVGIARQRIDDARGSGGIEHAVLKLGNALS